MFPDDAVFCENSTYPRHSIKDRIKARNLIEYKCACCDIGPEWQGKPMPLILDHINGINNDNRLDNLRIVTPVQNTANSREKINSYGHKGLVYDKTRGKWRSKLVYDGILYYTKRTKSKKEAIDDYKKLCNSICGEYSLYNK